MSYLTERNERKNRRQALVYTILITTSLAATVFFADRLAELPQLVKEKIWPTEVPIPAKQPEPVAGI